jgi:hypothetical protein
VVVGRSDTSSLPNSGSTNVGSTAATMAPLNPQHLETEARGDITITRNTTKYTVHANEFLTNGSDGLITVKSLNGKAATSGLAIQASSTPGGGRGGQITVESGGFTPEGLVTLGGATLQAKGSTTRIDTHVLNRGGKGVTSPADRLSPPPVTWKQEQIGEHA